MANLKEIQKRIASVKNTEKITYAMYMVSAAKLRRAQEAAENSRPYAEALETQIKHIASRIEEPDHPLLVPREEMKKAEVVIITSDRGLCGGYNANLNKKAVEFMTESQDKFECIDISAIGRKARDYMKRRKIEVRKTTTDLLRNMSYAMAAEIADELTERYLSREVDAVYLVYSQFKSALAQTPVVKQLLPFSLDAEEEEEAFGIDYIYEPSAEEILKILLPKQVRTQVYAALTEAVASEHGARMTAMDSASSNASDMIDRLTLQFNRARQAAITLELMEIISGAEALKD